MFKKSVCFAFFAAAAATSAQAGDVYVGAGFPGFSLGYAQSIAPDIGLRGEYTSGLNLSRNGQRNGVDFNGNLRAQSISAFGDYFPVENAFRFTGGLNFNNTKFTLNSTGTGTATINGRPVNLAGEFYNIEAKQPRVTPYLGIGYGFKPDSKAGWGFYADAGVMIGKFTTNTSTSLVGKQGITQADIDAQTNSVRDSVSKVSVLPKLSIGASYRF